MSSAIKGPGEEVSRGKMPSPPPDGSSERTDRAQAEAASLPGAGGATQDLDVLLWNLAVERIFGSRELPAVLRPNSSRPAEEGRALAVSAEPMGVFPLLSDVSRLKQAEEQLRETTETLAAMLQASPSAVVLLDVYGKVKMWNRAAQAIFGWQEEEVLDQPYPIVPQDRLSEFRANLEATLRGGTFDRVEAQRQRKDGSLIDVCFSAAPLRDPSNNVRGAVVLLWDITERKRTEQALRASEEAIQRQLERMTALRAIDAAITASLDLRVTLSVLLDQVTSQLRADAASVLLLDPNTQTLEYAAGRGFRTDAITHSSVRLGEGYAGRAVMERRPVSVPNLKEDVDYSRRARPMPEEEFLSYYAAPLIGKGLVKGVLETFHRTLAEPDPEWLDFVEALARQAAIAIDNATLFADLQRSTAELQFGSEAALEAWVASLDLRCQETAGHTERVTDMTVRLAIELGIPNAHLAHVRRGALLHDLGRMGIPDSILLKPGPLTVDEWNIVRRHPEYAHDLLSRIPFLREALDVPYCHHERWDGSGYPRGLRAEDIPLTARIFAVADVWDALRSDRMYRPAWPDDKAMDHIVSLAGRQFDPRVVEVFLKMAQ